MYAELIRTFAEAALHELRTNWQLLALFGALFLIALAVKLYRARRLAHAGINDIDRTDGATFEQCLEVLFRNLGYRVEQTQYWGDYDADLVHVGLNIKTVMLPAACPGRST